MQAVNRQKPDSLESFWDIWYNTLKGASERPEQTRYYGLNLHSFFANGSMEYRMFNGTCEPERIGAAVRLSLAMTAQALNREEIRYRRTKPAQEKAAFGAWLSQMGLSGKEFQKTRRLLLENFEVKPDALELDLKKDLAKEGGLKQMM